MSGFERTPLLDDTGGPPEPSFMQKVTRLLTADGEPGWASSTRFILLSSWSKVLILFVPLSLIADRLQWDAGLRFAFGILALIALIKMLGEAMEQISMRLGQTPGALMSASFGNMVEIILGVAALLQGELKLVQTSMLGLLLSNLLLVLGMSFFAGGLKYHEQGFLVTAAQTGTSLVTLACLTSAIPAAYYSSRQHMSEPLPVEGALSVLMGTERLSSIEPSHSGLLIISRVTAIILLIEYIGYLFFHITTHADLFAVEDEEDENENVHMSGVSASAWLLVVTISTSFCADVVVRSINETAEKYHISMSFIGFILLPLVLNAPDLITSIRMAMKGRTDLTIGIAIGGSIQIATFVFPLLVIISWITGKELTLYVGNLETICLFVSSVLTHLLIMDGKSNFMVGLILCGLYIVIAVAIWVS